LHPGAARSCCLIIIINYSDMETQTNKVALRGHLGASPEVRTLEGGRKMARFSMATNESYKNANGEKVTNTQWHQLVAWGRLAEQAEKLLSKGTEVRIEGKLVHRSITSRDGQQRTVTEVQVTELELPGSLLPEA
jgi:single-strand DNA-binding protein